MHQGALTIIIRQVARQPVDQVIHIWDRIGFRGAILFRPAIGLALVIISRRSVIIQTHLGQIDIVDIGQNAVHFVHNLPTFIR